MMKNVDQDLQTTAGEVVSSGRKDSLSLIKN